MFTFEIRVVEITFDVSDMIGGRNEKKYGNKQNKE